MIYTKNLKYWKFVVHLESHKLHKKYKMNKDELGSSAARVRVYEITSFSIGLYSATACLIRFGVSVLVSPALFCGSVDSVY